jgi:hypothetical protein
LFSSEVFCMQFLNTLILFPENGNRNVLRFSDVYLPKCVVPIQKTLMSVLTSHSVVLETVFPICVKNYFSLHFLLFLKINEYEEECEFAKA